MSRRTIIRGPLLPVWRALPPAAQRVVRKTVDRYSSLRRREPLLSVIVPVYNVEEYLEECLDSLMAQTLLDMQVVIIDDGSTDGSAQIYQRYAAANPWCPRPPAAQRRTRRRTQCWHRPVHGPLPDLPRRR